MSARTLDRAAVVRAVRGLPGRVPAGNAVNRNTGNCRDGAVSVRRM